MKNAAGSGFTLTADLGTTAVKVCLVDAEKQVLGESSREIRTFYGDGTIEQDPEEWYETFCEAVRELLAKTGAAGKIGAVSFSGQMQDLIMVSDATGRSAGRAILYSDSRAGKEAERILQTVGEEEVVRITGNHFDGSMPFAKLLWVKEQAAEIYARTDRILFSSKDYLIYRLTGASVTDVTTASTGGVMDIHAKRWMTEWAERLGINAELFPRLCYPTETAGTVTEKASQECGLLSGTAVFAGIGDAGASTLASGIVDAGEYNINLGTSGWVAQVSDHISDAPGVFNLAFVNADTYVNVTPFLNAGNVHKWISTALTPDDGQDGKYAYVDRLLEDSTPGSHGLLFLPYLNGERYPVSDAETRGAYIGISPETTKQDLARAALEGVAFSLKAGFVSDVRTISLIGGGAKVRTWCRIFADVLDHEVLVFENPDYMPSIAVAALTGGRAALEAIREVGDLTVYRRDAETADQMKKQYERFVRVYPAVKNI